MPLTVSQKFPEGTGDTIVQSVDDVLFYVSKECLVDASEVFASMFLIGDEGISGKDGIIYVSSSPSLTTSSETITLTEWSKVLEDFFSVIHLSVPSPTFLELDAVIQVLYAAHKYAVQYALPVLQQQMKTFVAQNPLRVHAVATKLELVALQRFALEAYFEYDSQLSDRELEVPELDILPARWFYEIYKARHSRVQWLKSRLDNWRYSHPFSASNPCGLTRKTKVEFPEDLKSRLLNSPTSAVLKTIDFEKKYRRCRECAKAANHAYEVYIIVPFESTFPVGCECFCCSY